MSEKPNLFDLQLKKWHISATLLRTIKCLLGYWRGKRETMKHIYLKSILLGLCLFLGLNAFAYDTEIDGIYYDLSSYQGYKATVTYKRIFSCHLGPGLEGFSRPVVHPRSVIGKMVCHLVVVGCDGFSEDVIPQQVTTLLQIRPLYQ